MRISSIKTALICLLFCSGALLWLRVRAQVIETPEKTDTTETPQLITDDLPFEAEEISISEGRIYVRTKDGKEFLIGPKGRIHVPTQDGKRLILGGDELAEEIIIEGGKIKIGDTEIDLKDLGSLEALSALLGLDALDEMAVPRPPRPRIRPRPLTSAGVFRMGKDVTVEEDEEIDGDVVALGGSVEIRGTVTGNAVAIGGDVDVFSTGIVEGDAVSVGGNVTKHGQAVVRGEKVSIAFWRGPRFRLPSLHAPFPFIITRFHAPLWGFFARIIKILLFIFIGIVTISILPRHVSKVAQKVKQDFLKSGLVGLAAEILIIPIFILLIITIIGIPVALLVEPLLIIAALILGYTGVCLFVGEKLQEHTSLKPDTKIMILVIGILAVELVPLLARVLGFFGGPFSPLGWIIAFVGWMIGYVVITVGLGASILTRLGTRPKEASPATATVGPAKTDADEKPLT
ncbi:MAG: hypothetical protein WBF13_05515 [Candidatus Zixiibacteriota bacterium]